MYMKIYDLYLIGDYTTLDFDVAEMLWAAYLKNNMFYFKDFQIYL